MSLLCDRHGFIRSHCIADGRPRRAAMVFFGAVLRPRRADKCKSEKGERRVRRFACVFRRDGEPDALFYRRVLCGQSRYFFRKQSEGNGAACSCRAACFGLFFVKNTVKIRKICPPKAKFLCRILSERARMKNVNLQNEYLCKNT